MEGEKKVETCYGIKCGNCKDECELKECGLSVIQEKKDVLSVHNGTNHLVYIDEMRGHSHSENDFEESLPDEMKTALSLFNEEQSREFSSAEEQTLQAIRVMAYLYLDDPKLFDAMIRSAFNHETQTKMAAQKGVSRAAVSKDMRHRLCRFIGHEMGMKPIEFPIPKYFETMTLQELQVYKLLFIDGCTERSAALQLGIPKSTIHDIGQSLRLKLVKNRARKKAVKKKS